MASASARGSSTPAPRVTAYNVEQAAGTVLRERFTRLAKEHGITPDLEPTPKTLANWLAYQNARLDVLRRFRILDLACGSGAFVIAAFDFLEDLYEEVLTRPDAEARAAAGTGRRHQAGHSAEQSVWC